MNSLYLTCRGVRIYNMFYTIKLEKTRLFLILLIISFVCAALTGKQNEISPVLYHNVERCLVIDAGHGGIDGGAIGINGMKESDINLDIALRLQTISSLFGEKTLMTRIDDSMRTDAAAYSEREDLIHRTDIINSVENGVLISIHQNCYPTPQPSGAQVLYSKADGSEQLGKIMHNSIVDYLEPSNRRVAEPASDKLYITSHAECPSVLVECGFMSNFSDLQKLCDSAYQIQLSAVIFASYMEFIDNKS